MNKQIRGRVFAVEVDEDRKGLTIQLEAKITQQQWDKIIKGVFGESIDLEIQGY